MALRRLRRGSPGRPQVRLPIKAACSVALRQLCFGLRVMNTCPPDWDSCDRAELLSDFEGERQMVKTRRTARRAASRRGGGRTKVRVQRGRVGLKVAGFPKLQYVSASDLVRHIPKTRLQKAAKKVLGKPPRRARKGRKGRKGAGRRKKRTKRLRRRRARR